MIRLFGLFVKFSLFVVFILVLGSWLTWDGKTVSDQVKTQLSHAENSDTAYKVRHWTREAYESAKEFTESAFKSKKSSPKKTETRREPNASLNSSNNSSEAPETIPSTERQKLRALIKELNHSN